MRERAVVPLVLLFVLYAPAQEPPAGWKAVRDAKRACQIWVPPEWVLLGDGSGAAVFADATTAIAVVTRQQGQTFQPLSGSLLKTLGIRKQNMFENTAKRVFYQEKTSRSSDDPSALSASVPGRGGTCSGHIVYLRAVSDATARQIMDSLGPVTESRVALTGEPR